MSDQTQPYDRVEPVLQAISPHVYYLGAFGRGIRAKYTAHLLLAGNSLVAAEALAFGQAAGLQVADMVAMLSGTIVSSAVFEERGPLVLEANASETSGHSQTTWLRDTSSPPT